jgi:hypothetical protein
MPYMLKGLSNLVRVAIDGGLGSDKEVY